MTYSHLWADCLCTGISSGPNARLSLSHSLVWKNLTFLPLCCVEYKPIFADSPKTRGSNSADGHHSYSSSASSLPRRSMDRDRDRDRSRLLEPPPIRPLPAPPAPAPGELMLMYSIYPSANLVTESYDGCAMRVVFSKLQNCADFSDGDFRDGGSAF